MFHRYSQCSKNSQCAERRQACCVLLSQPLQWYYTVRPACYITGHKWYSSDDPTSRSHQEWDGALAETAKLVYFVLFINMDSSYLNAAWHNANGHEAHYALSAVSPVVHCSAGVVIIQMETVYRRPLIVKVDVHKDQGRNSQLFLPKHLLKTAVGIVFPERNVDFKVCAGCKCGACLIYQQHSAEKVWRCCSSHSQNALQCSQPSGGCRAWICCMWNGRNSWSCNTLTTVCWEMWWWWANHLVLVPGDCSAAHRTYSSTSVLLGLHGLPVFSISYWEE